MNPKNFEKVKEEKQKLLEAAIALLHESAEAENAESILKSLARTFGKLAQERWDRAMLMIELGASIAEEAMDQAIGIAKRGLERQHSYRELMFTSTVLVEQS